jgi:lipoprotein-anchoring transpeptidase ErfK/SrfK
MSRRLLYILLPLALAGLVFVAVAFADSRASGKLADGTRVGGVAVGGLTEEQAIARLRDRIGEPAMRRAKVTVDGRTFTLSAEKAGVRLDLRRAVRRAHEAGRDGSIIERGWRELTGGKVDVDEEAPIQVDEDAVRSFVGSIHAAVARKPVDAHLSMEVTEVGVSPSKPGRRLAGRDDLVERLVAALKDPRRKRSLRATVAKVPPKVTEEDVWKANPVVVTVSRSAKTVRVFERGKVVKTYRVAVGEPKYPTPTGQFTVQTMQVNPPWNVPNSDWAGDLAGQTIPGGDPRNPLIARWIGFNGSVGFHGTKSLDSLGRSASHGCVRMSPGDVIDLYERVKIGTPVLVGG